MIQGVEKIMNPMIILIFDAMKLEVNFIVLSPLLTQ